MQLTVALGFGPRIISFRERDQANVLVELDDESIDLPDGRRYRLRGGHRLWAAPEIPAVTYDPDDVPVVLSADGSELRLVQPARSEVGIEKSLSVLVRDDDVQITHTLTNRGAVPIELAAWAITQLPVGGTALVPLADRPADPAGLQANASIVLWPYAGVDVDSFEIRDRIIWLEANLEAPTKVGTSLDRGWIAYRRDAHVFVKRAHQVPGAVYVDRGAAAQCYCDSSFIELETLGPLVTLHPDAATKHVETWEIHRVGPDIDNREIPSLLDLDKGAQR